MAKQHGAIKKAKRDAALSRRLARGQKKLAAKQARAATKATTRPKEDQ